MSLPTLLASAAMGGGTGKVTLSGETINHTGNPARAMVYFFQDGTVSKREGGTQTQIDAATDWIIPNGKNTGDYEFMWTVSGTAPTDVSAGWTSGTWATLTTELYVGYTRLSAGTEAGTFTISVRKNGGPTIDSAAYALNATFA